MIKRVLVDLHDATVYGFKTGDFREADSLEELNKRVMREFFAGLVIGAYDAVVVRKSERSVHVLTRSGRAGVPVQETMFCKLPSGEWVANCHVNVRTAKDCEAGAGNVYIYEAGEDVPELGEIAA